MYFIVFFFVRCETGPREKREIETANEIAPVSEYLSRTRITLIYVCLVFISRV